MTRRSNRFRLLRFRSPLLSQSRFLSFPPGTEMVHFPGFARARLWIHRAVRRVYQRGFPHSEISGSKPVCGSPKLIAAYHVLLRLLLPRHPPCALSSLTIKLTRPTAAPLYSKIHPKFLRDVISSGASCEARCDVEGSAFLHLLRPTAAHRTLCTSGKGTTSSRADKTTNECGLQPLR